MAQNHPRIPALSPPEVFTCGLLVKHSLAARRAVRFKAKDSNSTLSLASTSFFIGSAKLFTMLLCNQGYKVFALCAQRFGDKDEFLSIPVYKVQIYQ